VIWVIPEIWTCRLDCWCVAYGEWLLENVPAEQAWQSGQVGHVICEWCCSNWYCVDWIDFVALPFWGPEFRKGWSPIKDTCANGWKDILGIILNPQPCVVHLAFDLQFLVPICLSGGTVYWPREDAEDAVHMRSFKIRRICGAGCCSCESSFECFTLHRSLCTNKLEMHSTSADVWDVCMHL